MDKLTLYMRQCVNEEELFWDHIYSVFLGDGFCPTEIVVNADNEQDAIDFAVDHAEEQGWRGLWLDYQTDNDIIVELEKYDEVGYFGNHGLAVSHSDIHIVTRY